MVSFEQAPAKWSFWACYNCISDKALTEDSKTGVSVSKLGDRAVQDTEVKFNRCNESILTDVDHDSRIVKEAVKYIIDAVNT